MNQLHLNVFTQNTLTNTRSSKLKKMDSIFLKAIHIYLLDLMVLIVANDMACDKMIKSGDKIS